MSDPENPYAAPQASISQPTDMTGEQPLASRWVRLAGAIIDGVILMVIIFALAFALAPLIGAPQAPGFFSNLVWTVVGIGLYAAINYKFLLVGQTIGKRVMQTRMVDLNGNILPVPELVAKRVVPIWLLGALPFIGGLVGLVNALLVFRADRRCGHDLIANTKVVQIGPDPLAGLNLPGSGPSQPPAQG